MNLNEINNVNSFSMSDKRYINVPENIRYISDWVDIINILPRNQHYILNKIVKFTFDGEKSFYETEITLQFNKKTRERNWRPK